jgi:hypothetical protein
MQYYNAKYKFMIKGLIPASDGIVGHSRGGETIIMPIGGASRRVRGVRRSRSRGGIGHMYELLGLGGGKRHFRKRTCRSKSRYGGDIAVSPVPIWPM